ncbi:Ribonuclease 1 [Dichanthelium oligosanthes]|uniref:Ribonuclease 1 n=1 Tax=Dichanthelium oligosanthes TaxID=888268 RepID=A0A1E5V940_9POAL|nr:Ribonuclease 1 [Dichanthelium oligosanthes]
MGKPAADFGIHRLWPNYAKCHGRQQGLACAVLGDDALLATAVGRRGKCWPQFCDNNNPLSPWEIRDLVASLDKNWPTLSCKSGHSLEFWSYEWKKHGTCSNLEQHEYFSRALTLKAWYNLTSILSDAGIVPSDSGTYLLDSVRDAIGFTANLECNRDADGEAQLFQVYLCVDREAKELIDCPLSMPTKCSSDQVKLPVF